MPTNRPPVSRLPGDPAALVHLLTGCPPEDVAAACDVADLLAAHLLLEEALALQASAPSLRLVDAAGGGPDRKNDLGA